MVGEGDSFKHHILLTVGEDTSRELVGWEYYSKELVGWEHYSMGTVDKIPVFSDATYRLDRLAYRRDTGELVMYLERSARAPAIGDSTIKVVTPYNSVLFDTVQDGFDIYVDPVDGDPLNFRGNVGNTIPIYFDPQPDGYLDPQTLKPI